MCMYIPSLSSPKAVAEDSLTRNLIFGVTVFSVQRSRAAQKNCGIVRVFYSVSLDQKTTSSLTAWKPFGSLLSFGRKILEFCLKCCVCCWLKYIRSFLKSREWGTTQDIRKAYKKWIPMSGLWSSPIPPMEWDRLMYKCNLCRPAHIYLGTPIEWTCCVPFSLLYLVRRNQRYLFISPQLFNWTLFSISSIDFPVKIFICPVSNFNVFCWSSIGVDMDLLTWEFIIREMIFWLRRNVMLIDD